MHRSHARFRTLLTPACARSWSVLLACLLLPRSSSAATHHVPGDYPSIQSAIVAAADNDTVLVAPGHYTENLDTQGKTLTLLGSAGAEATVVDGGNLNSVLRIYPAGHVEGFTFQHGHSEYSGGGIFISGDGPTTVTDNIIQDNAVGHFDQGAGGGIFIYLTARHVLVEANIVRRNYAGDSGGGVYANTVYGDIVIRNNTIYDNDCHVTGGGADISEATFDNNVVFRNSADSFGGGLYVSGALIRSNTVVGNFTRIVFLQAAGIDANNRCTVSHNIVAFNHGLPGQQSGAGILCRGDATFNLYPTVECNDVWGNDGGEYASYAPCDTTGRHNFSADPLFCNSLRDDYGLSDQSPCTSQGNAACGLVGALGVQCGAVRVQHSTWGKLKVRYR